MSKEKDLKQLKILRDFAKLKIYDYFGRFDYLLKFFSIFTVVQFISVLVLVAATIFLTVDLNKKTRLLSEETKSLTLYLQQQKILNIAVLATRICAEYYNMSHFNYQSIIKNILDLTHPYFKDLTKNSLQERAFVITKGKIIQTPIEINYAGVKTFTAQQMLNKKLITIYKVYVPVKVQISKEGSENISYYDILFTVWFIKSYPSITNPYGLAIVKLGEITKKGE